MPAARIAGDPAVIADALAKIEAYACGIPMYPAKEAHPETAQMMIINPLTGDGLADYSAPTRPPDRVARLHAMANGQLPY